MAMLTDESIREAAVAAACKLGYEEMKPKQLEVITAVLNGQDVFAVLPTGFGKSLCFAALPFMFDQLRPLDEPSIVLVLSPLTTIMKDQVL